MYDSSGKLSGFVDQECAGISQGSFSSIATNFWSYPRFSSGSNLSAYLRESPTCYFFMLIRYSWRKRNHFRFSRNASEAILSLIPPPPTHTHTPPPHTHTKSNDGISYDISWRQKKPYMIKDAWKSRESRNLSWGEMDVLTSTDAT